jgi:hemerythrin-like domain-containing protein
MNEFNPVKLLEDDHDRMKALFRDFDETEIFEMKRDLFHRVAAELKVHTKVEEEIFYPAVRETSDQDELVDESVQEHHVVDLLIAELEGMNPVDQTGQNEFIAKFTVLQENVEHHIEEEELKMFPQAIRLGLHDEDGLAEKMCSRKEQLQSELHLL